MIIENVAFPNGLHCETTALGALLRHDGLELSEPMLFGLGEGLGFVYWDAKNLDFPFLGGRTKPGMITTKAAERLGIALRTEQTGSTGRAWRNVARSIDAGRPVGLQLDSYHLDYFTTKVHFGGHFVAMHGYDDSHAYLVDTAQQGGNVKTTLASLELARNQRGPMTARNLSYTVSGCTGSVSLADAARAAIRGNAEDFLSPPIANLGYRGILSAARQVPKWLERSADPGRDLTLAAVLMERGGTGGALFRAMYRDFLGECAALIDDDRVWQTHLAYAEVAPLWTKVSELIAAAGQTGEREHLADASAILTDLGNRERDAMQVLSGMTTA